MTRTQKALSHVNEMPKSKLVTSNTRAVTCVAAEAINSRRFVTTDSNHSIVTCTPHSPNIFGVLGQPNGVASGGSVKTIYGGDALAVAQSSLRPMLPFKIGEDGRIVNGIIRHTGNRTVLTATSGEDSEITQPNANDETITIVSNSASDDSDNWIWVWASQKTTGYPMLMVAQCNGTTAVTMKCYKCPDDPTTVGTSAYVDEVYGLYKTDVDGTLTSTTGTITLKNGTSSTTLITSTAAQTTRGIAAVTSTNYRNTYGDKAIITVSAAATDSIFLVGTDEANEPQYEIITYAASMPVSFETVNRWNSITTLVAGKVAAARTVAIAGRPSNVFEAALASDIADVTMTGVTQASGVVWVASSDAADVGASLTIIGVDSTTVHVEEITLDATDATTAVTSTNTYTQIMGMYVSDMGALTALAGNMTVFQTDGVTELFKFDGASYRCGGLLTAYKGNNLVTDAAAYVLHDICGCNARPTITSSNTAATHTFVIYGEDVDGTSQTELATFEDGVWESAVTWSRIFAIAGADSGAGASGFQATEYVKISFEQEDDLGSFAGFIYNAADAQGDEVEVCVGPIAHQRYASGPGQIERTTMVEIVGTTGVTRLDTHASATRTVYFPDASGTLMMTGASSASRIITVGASNCDYSTIGDAITAATAGDILWLMDATYTITSASLDFSKALEVIGMGDNGYTNITAGLTTDATVDISAAGCVFRNITFTASHNGAGDIAVYLKNVGAKFYDCSFNGGTNAAGIAIDVAADGADYSYFYNCTISDGIIDADGNAASIMRFYGLLHNDTGTSLFDTGAYYFYDSIIAGAITASASAAATMGFYGGSIAGAVSLGSAAATTATFDHCPMASTLTIANASSAVIVESSDITGAVTNTNSASTVISDSALGGALTITATTLAKLNNVYITGAFSHVAGTTIINGFTMASTLGITNATSIKFYNGMVTGATTHTNSTLTEFHDVSFTGAVGIVAATRVDISQSRLASTLGITGAATVVIDDSKVTGAITHTGAATVFIQNCLFDAAWTVNNAGASLLAYDCDFSQGLVVTNSAVIEVRDSKFDATTNSLQIVANATSCDFYNSVLTNALIIDGATSSFYNCTIEEIDHDEGTITLNDCLVTGAVAVTDTATSVVTAYKTNFLSTLTLADAVSTTVNLYDCHVVGAVGYTQTTAMALNAKNTFFDGLVTETSGVFTHYGCTFEGGMSGVTTQTASSAMLNRPATIRTVGTGCDYAATSAGLALAIADASAGDTIEIYQSIADIDAGQAIAIDITLRGMGDDITLEGARAANPVITIATATAFEAYNIRFYNSNNGAGDIAVLMNNVGGKFVNCEFDGGTNAAGIAMDANANGADYLELYNCTFTDGLFDYDGNAASIVRAWNTRLVDGGDSGAAGTLYLIGCQSDANFNDAGATIYQYGGYPTNIENDAAYFSKPGNIVTIGTGCDFATIAAYLVAGITAGDTLLLFDVTETVTVASLAISDAITIVGMSDDCLITSALAADATVDFTGANIEVHNVTITNTNNGAGDIAAVITGDNCKFYNCSFDGGTNAAGVALDIDLGAAEELYLHNCDVTDGIIDIDGNATSTMYVYDLRAADNIAIDTGIYYLHDARIGGTFTTGAAAAATIYARNLYVVGATTITASTVFEADGFATDGAFIHTAGTLTALSNADFASTVAITDATDFELLSGNITGTVTVTAGTLITIRDTHMDDTYTQTGGTGVVYLYNCYIDGVVTVNGANEDIYIYNSRFARGMTDAAGTYGIVEIHDSLLEGLVSTVALLVTAVGTSFTSYNSRYMDLMNIDSGSLIFYGGLAEELDMDGGTVYFYDNHFFAAIASDTAGTLNLYGCHLGTTLTVGGAAAGSTVNMYRGYAIGQVTRTAGTLNLYDPHVILAVAGTYGGNYVYQSANYQRHYEGGYAYKYKYFLCSFDNSEPLISGGADVISFTGIATGGALEEGDLNGGAATPGYWRFDAATEQVQIGLTMPDDAIITGTAADITFEIYADPTNATDKCQYAFYDWDGTELEGMGGANFQSFADAGAAWLQLDRAAAGGQGAILTAGQPIHLFLGNFNVVAGGDVTVDVFAIRMKYPVGVQNHV